MVRMSLEQFVIQGGGTAVYKEPIPLPVAGWESVEEGQVGWLC